MKMKTQTCKFVPLSAIPLTKKGQEDISESNFTFGDANRTLITLQRLLDETYWRNSKDRKVILSVIKDYGCTLYVDLEN